MRVIFAALLLASALAGCQNSRRALQPRHIETPEYDRVAYLVHIEGHIVVTATVDANGTVIETRASGQPMLAKSAMMNLRRWTFEKPKRSPWEQSFVYDYKLEGSAQCEVSPSVVTFDLPDRVEVAARPFQTCDPATEVKHRD